MPLSDDDEKENQQQQQQQQQKMTKRDGTQKSVQKPPIENMIVLLDDSDDDNDDNASANNNADSDGDTVASSQNDLASQASSRTATATESVSSSQSNGNAKAVSPEGNENVAEAKTPIHNKSKDKHKEKKRKDKFRGSKKSSEKVKKWLKAEAATSGVSRGSYVVEVTVPTQTERQLFHASQNFSSNDDNNSSPQYSEIKASPNTLWDLVLPDPDPHRRIEGPTSLRIRISLRKGVAFRNEYVALQYDECDHANEATKNYETTKPKPLLSTPLPFKHDLLANPRARGIYPPATTDILSPYNPQLLLADLTQPNVLEEWHPNDPDEYILNPIEIELAWLGEESMHCLYTGDFQWDFIWEYASPALRVELRCFIGDDRADSNNNNNEKLNSVVRMSDPLVTRRFEVLRNYIRTILGHGFRRIHMRRPMAKLRLVQSSHDSKSDSGTSGSGKKRSFPLANLRAASKEKYKYQNVPECNNGSRNNKAQRTK